MSRRIKRRHFLQNSLGGFLGVSSSGWVPALADRLAAPSDRRRQCILLWMSGGPSQLDTFDMKPDHANGGEFKPISTSVPGLQFSEHLTGLSQLAQHLAVVRGVSTREGDHQRGTYLMRTGQRPGSPIRFPCIGSSLAKALEAPELTMPNYFSINPSPQIDPDAFAPGFLGPRHAAATVGAAVPANPADGTPSTAAYAELRVDNLQPPPNVGPDQSSARIALWNQLQESFLSQRPSLSVVAQDTVYRRAMQLMQSDDVSAFDLTGESDQVRQAYGPGAFGQGCLLARRLIERGVPVVEVTLGQGLTWDTHEDNFARVKRLSEELDRGWATLLQELDVRGLLATTTIIWMGEFGRTPQINNLAGRDHFPNAWTCVLAGGGVAGGQSYGATSADGMEVTDGKVTQGDLLATLCRALGIDPMQENLSPQGRPHRIAEGTPIEPILV